MKCQDFERFWNEQLDARDEAPSETDRALADHARACPPCNATHARYQTLRHALIIPWTLPAVPDSMAERILAALAEPPVAVPFRPFTRLRRYAGPLTIAASLLVAGFVVGRPHGRKLDGPGLPPVPAPVVAVEVESDPQPLTTFLADATAVTLELAKETSGPATRLGRAVLDPTAPDEATPTAPASPGEIDTVSRVLRTVGDRLQDGMHPLSGSARQAFGFLLGPTLGDHGA